MLSLTSHIATSFLTLLTGLTISLVVARVINRLFWSPLSRFPGPRLAATTNIWQAFKGGQGTISRDLRALHVRTGCRILRYGPNHLSFWDPDAYKEIYVSQRFPKYPKFYSGYQMPHGSDSLFTTISNSASLARRRQLMPSLSRQSVIATEPLFHEQLAIFVPKLTNMAHERRTINLLMAFRCLTIDVISLYAFGRSIGTMQSEAFDSPLLRSFDKYVEGLYYRSTYPQIVKILDHLPSILQPACLRGYSTMKMLSRNALTEYRCQKRDYKYPVLFAKHVGQGSGLTDDELCSDAHTMVSAGSDTAGLTLALGIFYIYKNSEIRKRLHDELGAAYPHSSDVLKAHWADLEKLPFLSACVYESLRIAVPIGGDLPRVVTGGDWQFKGIRIPAGTVVSSSANAVNLNGDIFPEPQRFIPERWLDEQGRLSNAKETWLVSFSKGPRACIGQNMAMAELYIFMAAVVRLFEAEIPTDKDRIDLLEHYGSVPVGYDCPAIFHRIAETID